MAEYTPHSKRKNAQNASREPSCEATLVDRARACIVAISAPVWGTWRMFRTSAQKLRWFSPERMAAQFTYYRTISFFITLIWTAFIWAMILDKYFSDGVSEVLAYFTNVSLNIQAIYYTLDLISYFGDPTTRSLEMWLLFSFWAPVFAQAFDVFVMVIFVYLDDATIFTENLEAAGGPYDDGLVMFIERAAHVFPLIFGMIYYWLRLHDISDFLIMVYGVICTAPINPAATNEDQCLHARTSFAMRRVHVVYYIVYQYAAAAAPFCIYALVQNVRTVYGVNVFTNWMGVLAVLALNLICVVGVLYSIAFYYIPSRRIPASLASYHAYDEHTGGTQLSYITGIPQIVETKNGALASSRFLAV